MAHTDAGRRRFLRGGVALAGAALFGVGNSGRLLAADQQTLLLYNGQHDKTTSALVKAFTEATDIEVKIRNGHSSQLANQIMEEGENSPADVFYSEESPPVVALANRSLLAPLESETLQQIPSRFAAKDGTWIGASARTRVVAYNTDMIKRNELPDSVLDFATEEWKGKVAFVPTSGAFQEQIVAIKLLKGRDVALDWLKGLKAYGQAYSNNMAALRAVEGGDIATGLINDYYWHSLAAELGKENLKSALYHTGNKGPGALVTVSAAGILKSSDNQAAAQKFLAFMVSETGQQAIVDSVAEYPLRAGVKSPFPLKPFDQLEANDITPAELGDASDALALRREAGLA